MKLRDVFNQAQSLIKGMSISEIIAKIDEIIEQIKIAIDLGLELGRMLIEVLEGLKRGLRFGYMPHNITKGKLKRAVSALANLAKLETTDKENREFIDWLKLLLGRLIDENKYIKNDYQ